MEDDKSDDEIFGKEPLNPSENKKLSSPKKVIIIVSIFLAFIFIILGVIIYFVFFTHEDDFNYIIAKYYIKKKDIFQIFDKSYLDSIEKITLEGKEIKTSLIIIKYVLYLIQIIF